VEKKRRVRRPRAFWKIAVGRMKVAEDITALAAALGIHRRLLYAWRDRLEPGKHRKKTEPDSIEGKLRQEVGQLKRLLGEKTLELDFFKGALQKVEARRRSSGASGEKASTTKSEK
jgi:transposase